MEIIVAGLVAYFVFKSGIVTLLVSWWMKAQAAASVQSLLEQQYGLFKFEGVPTTAAAQYVQSAWDSKPDVFNGKFGKRPHKLAVILYALALAAKQLHAEGHNNFSTIMLAAANVVAEIETNGRYYPLLDLDKKLMQEAMEIIKPLTGKSNAEMDTAGFFAR